jgi:hypothetical protein
MAPRLVFWEDGRLRRTGRIDMTRIAFEGAKACLQVMSGDRGDREHQTGSLVALSNISRAVIGQPFDNMWSLADSDPLLDANNHQIAHH